MANLKDLIVNGVSRFIGNVYGSKFITDGGTSSLFVKGDGTLDSNTYLNTTDISSWAKQPTKPTYTAQEVGALPNTTVIPDVTGKEDIANKKTSVSANASSDTYYPTTKAVAEFVGSVVGSINTILDTINGEVL